MAFVHGKDSVFKLDNASGSLTDISAFVNNVDFPETADVAETTTLGDSSKSYIVGLKDATISISGLWDSTLDAILGVVVVMSILQRELEAEKLNIQASAFLHLTHSQVQLEMLLDSLPICKLVEM
jgi:hypothetical protein